MKPVVLFLSGLAATLVGASIRTCANAVPHELLNAWCGPTPHSAFASFATQHCAGCAVMYAGLATMLIAATLAIPRGLRALRQRIKP